MRASLIQKSLEITTALWEGPGSRLLWRCGAAGTLTRGWWRCRLVRSLWKTVSYKTEHTLTIWCRNRSPWYLPKGAENLCPHTILHVNVYSSFIHHCQNWKQPRCPSVGEEVNTPWYLQTWNALQCSKEVSYLSMRRHRGTSNTYYEVSEANLKKATYCMIPSIWHSGKGKTMQTVKRSVAARDLRRREGRMNMWRTGEL